MIMRSKTNVAVLTGFALLLLFQACKETKQEVIPCPTCYDFDSECVENTCKCKEGTLSINDHNWCAGRGQYLAAFDDWFCLDTLALTVESVETLYDRPSGQMLSSWSNKNQPNVSNFSPMYIVNEPGQHYIVFGGFIPTLAGTPGPDGYCDTLRARFILDFYGELVHPDTIIGHFIARPIYYFSGEGTYGSDTLIVPMYMVK